MPKKTSVLFSVTMFLNFVVFDKEDLAVSSNPVAVDSQLAVTKISRANPSHSQQTASHSARFPLCSAHAHPNRRVTQWLRGGCGAGGEWERRPPASFGSAGAADYGSCGAVTCGWLAPMAALAAEIAADGAAAAAAAQDGADMFVGESEDDSAGPALRTEQTMAAEEERGRWRRTHRMAEDEHAEDMGRCGERESGRAGEDRARERMREREAGGDRARERRGDSNVPLSSSPSPALSSAAHLGRHSPPSSP